MFSVCPSKHPGSRGRQMKTTAEYLELALKFELLASFEENPSLKADLEKQSAAYRKLAATGLENTRSEKP